MSESRRDGAGVRGTLFRADGTLCDIILIA